MSNPRGQVLPHSEESERAVLAAVLLSPKVLAKVSGRLVTEDFYLERHQMLYRAMLELQEAGSEIDVRTIQARLEHRGFFEKVGGLAYLAGLDLDLPDIGRVETYAEIVKERALRRRLIRGCADVARSCSDGGLDAQEALGQAEALVFGIGEEAVRRGFRDIRQGYEATLEELEQEPRTVPTGFHDFDRTTGGLREGNLIVLAARPGMGKTSLALTIARHAAQQGYTTGMYSLEMTEFELNSRVLSAETQIPYKEISLRNLSEKRWAQIYATVRQTEEMPLLFDDSPNPSLVEVMSRARRLKIERDLKLLVVDYLQLMSAGGRYENRQLEVAAITRNLKNLAKELSIPVVALSQLNRDPERRSGDHRPTLADLRESGAIEQDADLVCFIYRDEMYNKDEPDNKGLAELIIAKHRNGETGTIELAFLGETMSFQSLAYHTEAPF